MFEFKFETTIKDGLIEIPSNFQDNLIEGEVVTVSINKQSSKKTAAVGIIAKLMNNPVKFEGEPFKREEIYDRKLWKCLFSRF